MVVPTGGGYGVCSSAMTAHGVEGVSQDQRAMALDIREIRSDIREIKETLGSHGQELEGIKQTLASHGELLRQLLDRLPPRG